MDPSLATPGSSSSSSAPPSLAPPPPSQPSASSAVPPLPSPSPIQPSYAHQHSAPSSTSTSYQSSSSSSLLPSLPVGGTDAESSSGPGPRGGPPSQPTNQQIFPRPIIPFDPNAASDDEDEDDEGVASPRKKRKGAPGAKNGKGSGAEANGANADDKGRRKIEIEYIQKKEKRHITFSKRKAGIMKKAYELATLTGTQVLLLVVSETGIVYTFTTTKFQPLVGAGEGGQPSEGQRLIQKCLAVDPTETEGDFISPPPDGPLLPLPPSAQKRPFEANSPIHGGQIALRTKQQRPRAKKPAPIVPPSSAVGNSSLPPTPGIHSTLDTGLPIPPSPHHVHSLNHPPLPSPGHQLREYPPSPGYPPGPNGQRDPPSVLQSANNYNDMMERSSMNHNGNSPYGPPTNYPPPPALGYTHTVPNPNRPPHPLDPYPGHQQPHPLYQSHNSPSSSPQPPRRYLQAPGPPQPYPSSAAAPRSLAGPPLNTGGGGPPGPDPYADHHRMQQQQQYVDDPQMMMSNAQQQQQQQQQQGPPGDMYMHQQSQHPHPPPPPPQQNQHLQTAPQHHRMYSNEYGQR
ncbi:hypothetical protein JCM11491_001798 [Sporobolomyces phaffii]